MYLIAGETGVVRYICDDLVEKVLLGDVLVLAQVLHAYVKFVKVVWPLEGDLHLDALIFQEPIHVKYKMMLTQVALVLRRKP